jgi:hypothetical protein
LEVNFRNELSVDPTHRGEDHMRRNVSLVRETPQ